MNIKTEYLAKHTYPARHGHPWDRYEVANLYKAHQEGLSINQLAAKLERTEYAIECQLKRMGNINLRQGLIINGTDYSELFRKLSRIIELKIEIMGRLPL